MQIGTPACWIVILTDAPDAWDIDLLYPLLGAEAPSLTVMIRVYFAFFCQAEIVLFTSKCMPYSPFMRYRCVFTKYYYATKYYKTALTTRVQARWGFAEKRPTNQNPPKLENGSKTRDPTVACNDWLGSKSFDCR